MPRSRATPDTAAAIDLGSNSFHMIVARIQDGQVAVIDRIRDAIRLASGIDADNNIDAATQEQALECLRKFGQRLADFPPGSVRAVGTNTLRNANNSYTFLARAEEALGHPIDIISGVEEARLIYRGVAHSLAVTGQRRLVMDIGGGSTELIIGDDRGPVYMESMEMGCVTVSRNFFPDGGITPKRIDRARIFALTELEPHVSGFLKVGWDQAIGASGTIRSVSKVLGAAGWSGDTITLDGLKKLIEKLGSFDSVDKIKLDGLADERAPVFIGGAIVLLATFEALDIKEMEVSDRALREGLLHDLIGRLQDQDVRDSSIAHLAQRYHADAGQAQRVKQTALDALQQVTLEWGLDYQEAEQWLGWAAELHEIGLDIAHNRHHHHAAYIIEHSDLAGFSQQEQRFLAAIVRSQRRKPPLKLYKELPKRISKPVKRLSVILRLAVILHRGRSDTPLPAFTLKLSNKTSLELCLDDTWLQQHPLTQADLEQEKCFLANAGFELRLCQEAQS
ncbi:hypothetical protein Tel_02110 [Candidatus Tenderia electrophaga]|uniref:Exopolyphosphatase n=1 Tax=Candidatus Tenderia electrophaga TaxID=1748243 RepID=A0A0S2TA94_9GAMM|nr:hypothetical protein Tel_02110 [Candidatus Tenderia electrophaga]